MAVQTWTPRRNHDMPVAGGQLCVVLHNYGRLQSMMSLALRGEVPVGEVEGTRTLGNALFGKSSQPS